MYHDGVKATYNLVHSSDVYVHIEMRLLTIYGVWLLLLHRSRKKRASQRPKLPLIARDKNLERVGGKRKKQRLGKEGRG